MGERLSSPSGSLLSGEISSIMRGCRDFHTADDCTHFVSEMVEKRNRLVKGKLEQAMACLRPLAPAPMPEYANY